MSAAPAPPQVAATAGSPWLFGPALDLLFGAGLAYLATLPLLLYWGHATGTSSWPADTALFLSIAFASPHYGATLIRVYEQRADRRRYALFAVHLSIVMLALFALGLRSTLVGSLLLTAYVTWSPWHFAGQNYGISLLFLRRRGVTIDARTKRLLYASFVLSSALAILAIHRAGTNLVFAQTATDDSGAYTMLRAGIPAGIVDGLGPVLGVAYLATVGAAMWSLRREAQWSALLAPALLIATHALWFVLPSIGSTTAAWWATSLVFAPIWISTAHSLQYLWITSFYARRSAPPIGTPSFLARATLVGAAATLLPGLLFVPGLLGPSLPHAAGVGVLLFSALNVHHFLLDGAVWKLRDGRVARALLRVEAAAIEAGAAEPRHWLRSLVWAGGALGLFVIGFSIYERNVAISPSADLAHVEQAQRRLAWLGRDTPLGWMELGRRFERDGRMHEAIGAYRATLRALDHAHARPTPEFTMHLAALLLQHEPVGPARNAQALRLALYATQLAPQDPSALEVLAEASAANGDLDEARAVAERALHEARSSGATGRAASIERQLRSYEQRRDGTVASGSP